MSEERSVEKDNKLGNYIAYGISFGLLGGALLSLIGMMIDNTFLKIAGYGFGLGFGTIIGALSYAIGNRKQT
ncbi:hypothetical protein ACFOZY_00985 [Chungangia koreensis]|uniref:ATP synthase protein I n=1 Tax=Chungangia koreensis TaxID=752657 RepID=A0ABV8WZT2_9LACT